MNEFLNFLNNAWMACPIWLKAALILVVGLLAAFLARFLVSGILRLIRFDKLNDRIGVGEFLRKGGVVYTPSRLLGVITFWVLLIACLLEISRLLDLTFISSVFAKFADVFPGLLAAGLVAIVGWVIIGFIANFAITIARNAGFSHSLLLGKSIRYLGVMLIAIMSFEQITVGAGILGTLLLICFGALALGLAIAFGLGCKDLARDAMQKTLKALRESGRTSNKSDLEG